jgi:hypothetical protein
MVKGGRRYLTLRTTVWRPGRGPAGKTVAHLCSLDLWERAAVVMGRPRDLEFDPRVADAAADRSGFTLTDRRRLARAARRYECAATTVE